MILDSFMAIICSYIVGRLEVDMPRVFVNLEYFIPGYPTTMTSMKRFVNSSEFTDFRHQSTVLRSVYMALSIPFVTKFLSFNTTSDLPAYLVQEINFAPQDIEGDNIELSNLFRSNYRLSSQHL
jgi:hypothetical protein